MNENILEVKRLRQEGQVLIDKTKSIKDEKGGRERALAITKFQEARMWLGMALQEMGQENPYPTGCDPTTDKIDPPADLPK